MLCSGLWWSITATLCFPLILSPFDTQIYGSSYIGARQGGGGVKGRTYVKRLPTAYFHQFSKDVPKKESENNRPVILS